MATLPPDPKKEPKKVTILNMAEIISDGISKYDYGDGFNYVVNPPPIPKTAFGSNLHRECIPMKGPAMSSFMRRIQGEILSYPGPFEYQSDRPLGKKLPSKYGHNAFVNKVPRLPPSYKPDVPPLGTYDPEPPRTFKQEIGPFGGSAPRSPYPVDDNPGPASYPIHEALPKQKRVLAFLSNGFRWPAVYMFCRPRNTSLCMKCKKVPKGDYFHNFKKNLDLCRFCMKLQRERVRGCEVDLFLRQKKYNELDEFKPARYCGFFHNHSGTSAAVQLIPTAQLHKKVTVENYLYQFERNSPYLPKK